MVSKINLEQYTLHGGLVENLNMDKTFTTYGDSRCGLSVSNISFSHMTKPTNQWSQPSPIYLVTYTNGMTHKYAGMWIETSVKMVLDSSYTKESTKC